MIEKYFNKKALQKLNPEEVVAQRAVLFLISKILKYMI